MATEVRRRRGTSVEHSTFTGAIAELTVDLTKDTVVVHDGATQGGFPLLREDLSNVPTTAPFTHITLDTAIFDTAYTETGSETQGTLYWNQDEETLSLVTNGETIELGQKVEVHVKNQTGSQINKGEVVYASGTLGASGRILVTKMIADGTVAAKRVLGVAAENIADGADGKVIKFGKLRQINTSTFSNGDILWVSTTTAGGFQNTEPVQANGEISLPIAYVVYSSASVGEIFVRVTPIDENEYTDYADYVELRSDVIENHLEIESLQDNKVEVGFLFPDGDGQALGTGDNATFNTVTLGEQADSANEAVRADRTVSAGNGLTGGGALTGDVTISMDTPSTLTVSTSNEVTTGSHTHALDLSGRSITLSDDSDGVLTFDTNTQNLGADRTYTPTIADHANGQRGVLSIGAQTIFGAKTFNDATTFDTSALLDNTAKIESEAGYVAGFTGSGFNLSKDTTWKLELDDMYIRGALFASEFIVNQISAVNGSDILSPGRGKVEEINSNFYTVSDPQGGNFASFAVNDIVIVQQVRPNDNQIVKRIVKQVTDVTNNVIELSTLSGAPSDSGSIEVGDLIVAIGNTTNTDRQANIFRTVTDNESPYVRVNDGIASWADWTGVDKLKVQYGNLDSLTSTYSYSADPGGAYPAFEVSGYGFFSDNAYLTGELRVGDLQSYGDFIEYNSTDGLTIKIGDDNLSTAIADIRSDLINIYLGNESSFSNIQFLSGQLVLKAGTGNSIASITLDGTQEDVSTISLDADYIVVTGTTIFKSAKDGSTTPTTLGDATFIDGGTIVTNSITATEIDVDNLFAQEIEVTGKLLATDGTYETTVGKLTGVNVKIGASTSNGDFYGLYRDLHNYFGIHDGDVFAEYAFRVGDANNYLEFDGTDITINTDTFDLDATTLVIDSGTNSGKIALGATPPTAYNSGTGIYFDGTGKALIGNASGNKIQFDGTNVNIQSTSFNLSGDGIDIDTAGSGIASPNPTQTQSNLSVNFKSATSGSPVVSSDVDLIESERVRVLQIVFDYDISGGDAAYDIRIVPQFRNSSSGTWSNPVMNLPIITYPSTANSWFNTNPLSATLSDQSTGSTTEFKILSSISTVSDKVSIYIAADENSIDYSTYDAFRFIVYHQSGAEVTGSFNADMYVRKYCPSTAINPEGFTIRQSDTIYQETIIMQDKLPIRQDKTLLFV